MGAGGPGSSRVLLLGVGVGNGVPGSPPVIPGFSLVSHLGSGGFADVFLYQELWFDRLVAIKVVSGQLSDEVIERFTEEANLMARLSNHPSIVTVYRAGVSSDRRPFLVMEYCSQPNLDDRYRLGRFGEAEVLSIGIEIAGAVETVHRAGIVHRDIKPANILTTDYGRRALSDFGIAAAVGSGVRGLSVPWAPPEVFDPGVVTDERGDVYGLAATLFTLLAGRAPFAMPDGSGTTGELVERIRVSPVPVLDRADVSVSLREVLTRGMSKAPGDRYGSAMELGRALQQVQGRLALPQTGLEVQGGAGQGGLVVPAREIPIREVEGMTQTYDRVTGSSSLPPDQVTQMPSPLTQVPVSQSPVARVAVTQGPEQILAVADTMLKPPGPPIPPSLAAASAVPPAGGRSRRAALVIACVALLTALVATTVIWQPWQQTAAGSNDPDPAVGSTAAASRDADPDARESKRPIPAEVKALPAGAPLSPNMAIVPMRKKSGDERRLYLVDTTGTKRTVRLAASPGTLTNPMLDASRSTIIFRRGLTLDVMASNGSRGRLLSKRTVSGCDEIGGAGWNQSDPRVLALMCGSTPKDYRLIIAAIDGERLRQLDIGECKPGSDATISPDGKRVLYWCGIGGKGEGGSLQTVRIDGGGEPAKLTSGKLGWDSDPTWSPDGSQIAFRRMEGDKSGNYNVYVMNADGTGLRVIAGTKAVDMMPSWSPDGTRLLVLSDRTSAHGKAGKTWDLWVTRVHDGKVIKRLGLRAHELTTPTWGYR